MPPKNPYKQLAVNAARAADDKKGIDIIVLDIHAASDIADFVVISSVESVAQLNAIETAIENDLRLQGHRPIRRDGGSYKARAYRPAHDRFAGGGWTILDYGSVMVHILLTEAREFYRLEQLWETAKKVKWEKGK